MTITPELAQVIAAAIDSDRLDLHTAVPGEVQSYDANLQTADIVLQVKRMLPGPKGVAVDETLPTLSNVPVAQLGSESHTIYVPINKGTTGMVIFSEVSIDQWRAKGTVTSPSDVGRHTLTGGVFYPGLMSQAAATESVLENPENDMVIGRRESNQIRVKSGTVEIVAGGIDPDTHVADDFVAMAGRVLTQLTALVAKYDIHTHASFSAPPVPLMSTPTSVASGNLKANNAGEG